MLKKHIFCLALLASPAAAQDPEFARVLAAINAANPAPAPAEVASASLETLQALAAKEGACTPTAIVAEAPAAATSTALVTQLIGARQIKNAWTVNVTPQGCTDAASTRLILMRMPAGELRAQVVNVGESLTPPSMMWDSSVAAAMPAVTAIQKAHPDCKAITGLAMTGSRIVSRSDDLGPDFYGSRYAGSWQEAWTFSLCGHRAEVPITFVTDGQGGARWSVDERDARLID